MTGDAYRSMKLLRRLGPRQVHHHLVYRHARGRANLSRCRGQRLRPVAHHHQAVAPLGQLRGHRFANPRTGARDQGQGMIVGCGLGHTGIVGENRTVCELTHPPSIVSGWLEAITVNVKDVVVSKPAPAR